MINIRSIQQECSLELIYIVVNYLITIICVLTKCIDMLITIITIIINIIIIIDISSLSLSS